MSFSPKSTSAGSNTTVGLPRISSRRGSRAPASSQFRMVFEETPMSSARRRRVMTAPNEAFTTCAPRLPAADRFLETSEGTSLAELTRRVYLIPYQRYG